jgi:YD repeat-containing protein
MSQAQPPLSVNDPSVFSRGTVGFEYMNSMGSKGYWLYPSYQSGASVLFSSTFSGAVDLAIKTLNELVLQYGADVEVLYEMRLNTNGYPYLDFVLRQNTPPTHVPSKNFQGDGGQCKKQNWLTYLFDPIHAVTGNLSLRETDVVSTVPFVRYYNSLGTGGGGLSAGWSYDYSQRLLIYPATGSRAARVSIIRHTGDIIDFVLTGGVWTNTDSTSKAALTANADGTWRATLDNGTSEAYNTLGQLIAIVRLDGSKYDVSYPIVGSETGLKVADAFGRGIKGQMRSDGYIDRLMDLNENVLVQYGYTSNDNLNMLTSVTYQNDSYSGTRTYLYENASFPISMTGLVDENNSSTPSIKYATWTIGADGKTTSSANGSGVNGGVIDRTSAPTISATDQLGTVRQMTYQSISGHTLLSSVDQPAGAGCNASTSTAGYDTNGNVTQKDDFNGHRICYANDTSRNLETVRIEGLTGATGVNAGATPSTCSTALSTPSSWPAGSHMVSTQWHPNWALKTKQAEPLKLTTWVYNGQTDPFTGQVANCITPTYSSSPTLTLPDGSPIAVLCKKVEQATLDADGHLGLSATEDTSSSETVSYRQWTYSYTEFGQLLTSTDAMAAGDDPALHTTTYAYYPSTTSDWSDPNADHHYMGDLQQVTNPQGHVTLYKSYDRAGHLLSMSDPNGLLTKYTYSPRGWVTSVNVGGLNTAYDYWPTGLLKKATQPDGSYLYYQYDDAHRLTDVSDQVDTAGNLTGNKVHYTLDNAGNTTGEAFTTPSGGTPVRNVTRTYDALNRLQTVKGSAQ